MNKSVTGLDRVASFKIEKDINNSKDHGSNNYFCTCLFSFLPKFLSRRRDIIPRPNTTLLDLELDSISKSRNSFGI